MRGRDVEVRKRLSRLDNYRKTELVGTFTDTSGLPEPYFKSLASTNSATSACCDYKHLSEVRSSHLLSLGTGLAPTASLLFRACSHRSFYRRCRAFV